MVIADVQSNIRSSAAAIPLMVIDCLDADLPLQILRAICCRFDRFLSLFQLTLS
jgi:hypothetical protein